MNFKQCIIMRGTSGSGKSTFAKALAQRINAVIVSADDHFVDMHGQYCFDPRRLPAAHNRCFDKFLKCLKNSEHVIVDNTNAHARDAQQYVNAAHDAEYDITIVEMMTPVNVAATRNIHGVPETSVQRQASRMSTPIANDDYVTWRIDGTSDTQASIDMVVDHLL